MFKESLPSKIHPRRRLFLPIAYHDHSPEEEYDMEQNTDHLHTVSTEFPQIRDRRVSLINHPINQPFQVKNFKHVEPRSSENYRDHLDKTQSRCSVFEREQLHALVELHSDVNHEADEAQNEYVACDDDREARGWPTSENTLVFIEINEFWGVGICFIELVHIL